MISYGVSQLTESTIDKSDRNNYQLQRLNPVRIALPIAPLSTYGNYVNNAFLISEIAESDSLLSAR